MLEVVIQFLEQNMLSCFWFKTLGIICPGCGIQRAAIALLKGNLLESFTIYPALIPVLVMFLTLALHVLFKWKKGPIALQWMYFITLSFIVISFIHKLI